jgi:protein-S-isoprenylcysteine O-methyltransferase Ste14
MVVTENGASSRFVWPPAIYGAATLVAALLAWRVPLDFVPDPLRLFARIIGIGLIICGLALDLAAARIFKRAGTPVAPTKSSTAVVTDGIYSWTRNPMYLGLSLILFGIGLATGSVWFLVALPIAVFAVTKLAIEREEVYLANKFGAAYEAYRSRVRRWF